MLKNQSCVGGDALAGKRWFELPYEVTAHIRISLENLRNIYNRYANTRLQLKRGLFL